MPEEQPVTGPAQAVEDAAPRRGRWGDSERYPVDPDADLHQPGQLREWTSHRWVLPVIALGGMVGASARHGLELAWPVGHGQLPWATFVTNVAGCVLIGLVMVYVVELGAGHPLLRPFLGVGVLGGFTTFSTYAVQTADLTGAGEPTLAMVYLFGTVVAALAGVVVGVFLGRSIVELRGHVLPPASGADAGDEA